jgi:hypothetical protein
MPPARTATAAMLIGAVAGCGLGADPPPVPVQIVPAIAYNDAPVAANIYGNLRGGTFRPAYQFDTMAGSAGIEVSGFSATLVSRAISSQESTPDSDRFALDEVTWVSVGILSAIVPAGVPNGEYDLIVVDPQRHSARLTQAFTSLGTDTIPPTVSIKNPTDIDAFGAGAPVEVLVLGDDGYGVLTNLQVTITAGTAAPSMKVCSLTGGSSASCTFSFPAPAPTADGDMLAIDAQAKGSGGLIQTAHVSVPLYPAPVPTGISPPAGSTLGGTVVTLSGADFVGATKVAFDGQVATRYDLTPTSITVLTPAHLAGPVTVTVTTGGATATLSGPFSYQPPPTVREVSPTSGPAGGFTPITIVGENFGASTTVITFDGRLLVCPRFVNANRIEGFTPPGMGTETIEASDAIGGSLSGADVPYEYQAVVGDGSADAAGDGAVYVAAPLTPDAGCPGSGGP